MACLMVTPLCSLIPLSYQTAGGNLVFTVNVAAERCSDPTQAWASPQGSPSAQWVSHVGMVGRKNTALTAQWVGDTHPQCLNSKTKWEEKRLLERVYYESHKWKKFLQLSEFEWGNRERITLSYEGNIHFLLSSCTSWLWPRAMKIPFPHQW